MPSKMPSTTTLNREYEDESSGSERQKQVATISLCASNILDIPDKILRKIILLLNARERLPLGNTCQRFKNLVFEDIELLRDLDFSKDVHLTSAADIQQYFNNENTFKHIRRLNIRNVGCMKAGYLLNNSLGKALNLVDINIHGLQFKDIWQLAYFLNPLIRVQRLSLDWPQMEEIYIPLCLQILQKPFSRLLYLSVKMTIDLVKLFIPSLRLCHELRQLHMVVQKPSTYRTYTDIWGGEMKELRNLEIVEYCGPFLIKMKELLVTMLQEPQKWTDFQLNSVGTLKGFYLEKNVEVCEELLASKWTERVENPAWNYFNLGWALFPECLLREVLKLNYQNLPGEFCCLSEFMHVERCLLKVEDAKGLLKNPRHQISYLRVDHAIELGCDVHLVASAFSNLTELVLCSVTRNLAPSVSDIHFQRRRKRRASVVLEEECESLNLDSSFRMLVQNTPFLRHFTLNGFGYQNWDLDELHLISSWKSLETLRLLSIPIEDGHFLIKIGSQCKHLQKLELFKLGSSDTCCYKKELFQILPHFEILRDFSIEEKGLGTVSEVFTMLAKNQQLRKVSAKDLNSKLNADELKSSIKELLRRCPKLTTCVFNLDDNTRYTRDNLRSTLQRLKSEINRPNLKLRISFLDPHGSYKNVGSVPAEDEPASYFP